MPMPAHIYVCISVDVGVCVSIYVIPAAASLVVRYIYVIPAALDRYIYVIPAAASLVADLFFYDDIPVDV